VGDSMLRCICLTAPTACGKTELAMQLAERLPIEIVSMDSAIVYRGMDIGTAKPSREARAAVPHHLIDILDPSEAYSAGRFCRDAAARVAEIRARGRVPLLVGGTQLYLRAFRDGLASLPNADHALRRRLDEDAARVGWPALHERLRAVDPETAARIAPTDRQRIQRALEVCELAGKALSELQHEAVAKVSVEVMTLALLPKERRRLADKIERRFDAMVEAGFVEEVARLKRRADLRRDMPSVRAVGYRQIWSHLAGESSWHEARGRAIAATRQLAKRQMTWLRADGSAERFAAFAAGLADQLAERIEKRLERWAETELPPERVC
jgi:tRNA dimethylallyltransferase